MPVKIMQIPGNVSSRRLNKGTEVKNGGLGYRRFDVENRAKHKPGISQGYVKQREYKAGRNEQCPCGSGLKFKRCCIDK